MLKRLTLAILLGAPLAAFAFEPPTIGSESAVVEGNQVYGADVRIKAPPVQTIASGATIAADACDGIKRVTAAGAVSTSTSTPLATPSSQTLSCTMNIVNIGANTITIKAAPSLATVSGADISLAPGSSVCFVSSAALWHQCAAVVAGVTPTATPTFTPTNTATPTATATATPTP